MSRELIIPISNADQLKSIRQQLREIQHNQEGAYDTALQSEGEQFPLLLMSIFFVVGPMAWRVFIRDIVDANREKLTQIRDAYRDQIRQDLSPEDLWFFSSCVTMLSYLLENTQMVFDMSEPFWEAEKKLPSELSAEEKQLNSGLLFAFLMWLEATVID